ncbi:MAG: sensor domain-containing diguanylate cyclase [Caldisericota bacterium]|jgi:diguanylate cyclase (GGDEF)-like protein|nr:sensor domain-containing diguanylate cyclase [Caldisericota bacterium]
MKSTTIGVIKPEELQSILNERSYHKALQRAAEAITRAVPSSSVTLMTIENGPRIHFEAWANIPAAVIRRVEKSFNGELPRNIAEVLRTRETSLIEDLRTYADWRAPLKTVGSWVGFPIVLHSRVVALINVQTIQHRMTALTVKELASVVQTISLIVLRYQERRELATKNRHIDLLYHMALASSQEKDLQEVLQSTLGLLGRLLGYTHADILVYDEARQVLMLTANRGREEGRLGKELDVNSSKGVTVKAFRECRPVIVKDTTKSADFIVGMWPARSELAVPLVSQGRCVGIVNIESQRLAAFSRSDIRLLSPFVSGLALLIDNFQKTRLLHEQAMYDGLTGTLNRRSMDETLKPELERAGRYHHDLALVMLDLDDFKTVNDQLGHQEGDRLLRSFADCIRKAVRNTDLVFRYGGDEFLIVLPETSREQARSLLERLNTLHWQEMIVGLGRISFSAGIASVVSDAGAIDLLQLADNRLYESKRLGKGLVTDR